MRIEIIDNALCVDKQKVASNFKANIEGNSMRAKMNCIMGDGTIIPVDFMVYNFTSPQLSGFSLCSTIDGCEMVTNSNFRVSLSFNLISKEVNIKGTINGIDINENITSLISIPNEFSRIINNTVKRK